MITLYGNLISGNDYKVRLLLTQLAIPFHYEHRDVFTGETRTQDFLAINPNGRIPTVEFEDGRVLPESNAIMFYFAQGTEFWPKDRYHQAQAMQWMCFEQYSHEPYVAVPRFLLHLENGAEIYKEDLLQKWEKGYQALTVMEQHLAGEDFFAGGAYSIADIALYAYTHVAEEAKFELSGFPNIRAWLDRVGDQPGHILITQSEFG